MTTLLGTIFSALLSIGLTAWVYKVLMTIIKEVKEENSKLKIEIEQLKQSESRWFQRYQGLVNLILKHKQCKNGDSCAVYEKYVEKAESDGIL